jgi:hypothetical protein
VQRREGGERLGQGKHRGPWAKDVGPACVVVGPSGRGRMDMLGMAHIWVKADPGANRRRNASPA